MNQKTELMIIGWIGMGVCLCAAMFTTFFISMSNELLKTNPNLEVNLVFFNGKLVDVFPWALLSYPIMLFPMAMWFYSFIRRYPNKKQKVGSV